MRGAFLTSELWQFAVVLGVFMVVALLWLFIIYLPARTMEHSESQRTPPARETGGPEAG